MAPGIEYQQLMEEKQSNKLQEKKIVGAVFHMQSVLVTRITVAIHFLCVHKKHISSEKGGALF